METDLATMADQCVAAIQYFVGVYTALVFYRYPETWEPKSAVAGKHKASLSSALMSVNENKDASVFEALCSHKVVATMRQDMQILARVVAPVESGPLAKWAAGAQALGQVEEAAVDAEAVGVRGAVSKGASGQVAGRKRSQKKSTAPAPKAISVKPAVDAIAVG